MFIFIPQTTVLLPYFLYVIICSNSYIPVNTNVQTHITVIAVLSWIRPTKRIKGDR